MSSPMPIVRPAYQTAHKRGSLARGPRGWLQQLGLAGMVLGRCLGLYLDVLRGRARFDLPAFTAALQQSGRSMVPAMSLVSIAVGLILGRQTLVFLDQFDLPGLILLSVGYTLVMEVSPLLVGVLVAGRAGVALAVRLATLALTGERDGLIVCGVDPLRFTAGPVLLALLVMSLVLVVWTMALTLGAAAFWLWLAGDLPPALFVDALARAIRPVDLLVALAKPVLFALLVVLLAGANGLVAGGSSTGSAQCAARGIERAATRTMIGGVALVLLADLLIVVATRA